MGIRLSPEVVGTAGVDAVVSCLASCEFLGAVLSIGGLAGTFSGVLTGIFISSRCFANFAVTLNALGKEAFSVLPGNGLVTVTVRGPATASGATAIAT